MGGARGRVSVPSAGLRVVDPGHFTTVQDAGRFGYRSFGVTVGGAFDLEAHVLSNALVGNDAGAATLEMTLRGGVYEAVGGPLALALVGGAFAVRIFRGSSPLIRASGRGGTHRSRTTRGTRTCRAAASSLSGVGADRSVALPGCFTLGEGERLEVGGSERGARAYLAVAGGWRAEVVLGSRSSERPVVAGALLDASAGRTPVRRLASGVGVRRPCILDVMDGMDATDEAMGALVSGAFRVASASDRVGLRLEGPPVPLESGAERLSAPVAPGAVQVAGDRPIVLGPACGTMGGYPSVAHVTSRGVAELARLGPGEEVRFRRVELAEAYAIGREWREGLRRFGRIVRCAAGEEPARGECSVTS